MIALEQGDVDAAAARASDAFSMRVPLQSEPAALPARSAVTLAAARGEPFRAATLWGAAEHAYARIGIDDPPLPARLRARWEGPGAGGRRRPGRLDAAWEAGAQLPIEVALAVAAGWRDDIEIGYRASVKPSARV